ncbi:MFS transporter [Rhodococcus sp. OK302]|uniref:MFS transporter n=1 Tax=Rhodococcus sp. OK302 TaxID=1882769 RepID=UPI000B93D95E|nr:MFS transporter [Rhodococcus sp. OK302]OYD61021.1 MFS transporter [Rhodococcus sp. OK302]
MSSQPQITPGESMPRARVRAAAGTGRAFAVLAVVQATLIFTITLIAVPLPLIGREFGLDSSGLVLVNAAYGLPYSGLLLFGGRLTDRFGGRQLLVIGLAIFGLASLAGAFAPTFTALVVARFVQGIGAALTAPAALAILRAVFTDGAAFGRAMAAWGGVSVLGAAAGTVVSGAITTWVSWRWMFVIPVVVTTLTLALHRRLFPAAEPDTAGSPPGLDPLGAVLATLGISIGSYGLILSLENSWTSAGVLVSLVIGLALLVAFTVIERRVRQPLLPAGFIGRGQRLFGLVGILLSAAGSGLIAFLLALYLQNERGWTTLATAGAFIPYTAALIASNRAAGPLIGRFGAMRVATAGLIISATGLALLANLHPDTDFVVGLLPGLILLPAGASLVFSAGAVLAIAGVPASQSGLAGGVMNTAMELGPTVGFAVLMAVAATRIDTIDGYAWAFGAAAAAHIVAAIVGVVSARRTSTSAGDSIRTTV